jgi:O-antigen ligase
MSLSCAIGKNGMKTATTQLVYVIAPVMLLLAGAMIVAIPLDVDDEIAVGALALSPIALASLYVVAQGVLGHRHSSAIMAVIYIFVAAAIFRTRAYDDKSIDIQVAAKLGAFAVIFATNFFFFTFALGRIRFPRLFYLWLAFFLALTVCALYAVKVPFALTCAVLFLAAYLYGVYMAVWLSRLAAVQVMMCAALLLCVGSIFVYYAVPSIGVMQAWTPEGGFGEIGRMKGLTGSANGIGLIAAFAIALAVLYFRSFGLFGKCTALILIPSAAACLVLSNNRSSMIALAAVLWVSFVFRRHTGPKLMASLILGLIGLGALVFFSDEIFAILARSGHADEITSATGRAAIWSVVLEMWAQRPLYGYGYTSALSILPLDPRLFHVAAHAHNMYLELLFAGGVILLGLFLYALWQTVRQAIRLRAVNELALLVFFMLRGLTEATPFSGMVGYSSLAFAMTLGLVIAPLAKPRSAAVRPRPLTAPAASPVLRQSRL